MGKLVAAAALLGFFVAAAILGVMNSASHRVVFEADTAKTLGLQFEETPRLAQRPLGADQIADGLGLDGVAQLNDEVRVFESRVEAGFLGDLSRGCRDRYSEALCSSLEEYFDRHAAVVGGRPRTTRKVFQWTKREIPKLQLEEFSQLIGRMPDLPLSKMREFAALALKSQTCPRNFSLALAHKMEIYPEALRQHWGELRKLHESGLDCVQDSDAQAEWVRLRFALLLVWRQDPEAALKWLDAALEANTPDEDYRARYWLASTLNTLGNRERADDELQKLWAKHPLSWYSILTKTRFDIDPLDAFASHPVYVDLTASKDLMAHRRVLWLEAIFNKEKSSFASKKYGEFVVRSLGDNVEPGFIQFLARSLDRNGYHRLQILLLTRLYNLQPTAVTKETLRLLYPKPFFDELDRSSPMLDTALLLGLARQESGFDPAAQSTANARGLLQILPSTAKGISKRIHQDELYDFDKNIDIGSRYILRLVSTLDGSVERALASYNAGQGNVARWQRRFGDVLDVQLFMDLIPFKETRDYVPVILRNAYWYHRLFPEVTETLVKTQAKTAVLLESALFREETSGPVLRFGPDQLKRTISSKLQDRSKPASSDASDSDAPDRNR